MFREGLFFDVDRISIEVIRIDKDYFPCQYMTMSDDAEGRVVASLPLENGAELVVLIRHENARAYLWDAGSWCKVQAGRIVPAGTDPKDDWNEPLNSTDDIKSYMRQFGPMEASRFQEPDQASSRPAPSSPGDMDSTLAELLA